MSFHKAYFDHLTCVSDAVPSALNVSIEEGLCYGLKNIHASLYQSNLYLFE